MTRTAARLVEEVAPDVPMRMLVLTLPNLGDCSMDTAECGDGEPDPGEACDSTGTCTSSCTMASHCMLRRGEAAAPYISPQGATVGRTGHFFIRNHLTETASDYRLVWSV
jgi:hypothetical protein